MSAPGFFAKKSLKTKIMASMLMAGVVPLLLAATIINWRSGAALEGQSLQRLESLAQSKKHEVEDYFRLIDDQVKFMAQSRTVVEAMKSFKIGFEYLGISEENEADLEEQLHAYYANNFSEKFKAETGHEPVVDGLAPTSVAAMTAQMEYIVKNPHPMGEKHKLDRVGDISAYSDDHAQFHPVLRDFLERFGYYDIFLVEPKNGDIVYSVYKELDFATSLKTGPYADTPIGEVFRAALALSKGESAIIDFAPYLPSYNAAAAFVASPVYDMGTLHGVLIFQMPVGRINAIVQQAEGMGESGEAFLVGQNGLMRTQSRLIETPTILQRTISSKGLTGLDQQESIAGQFINTDGVDVLGSYARLNIPGLDWSIGAEIHADEALLAVSELQLINLGLVAVTGLLVALGSLMFASRTSGRIQSVVRVADAIASGNFKNKIDASAGDELQDLSRAMHRMQTELFGQMREKEVVMNRLKAALDNANANVMVADTDHTIIYLNKALEKTLSNIESNFRAELPDFRANNLLGKSIDEFHKNPEHTRGLIAELTKPQNVAFSIGGKLLELSITPIVESGERLGTVTEWTDMTDQRAAENDVARLIENAKLGDLGARLDLTRYQGFYRTLALGLNDTLKAVERPIAETRRVMESLADGNLAVRFSGDFQGEFKHLAEAVNNSTTRLAEVITQLSGSVGSLTQLSHELSRGNADLHDRTTSQAGSLQETAAAMEEITGTVEHNTENARHANQLSEEAVKQAQEGNRVVNSAIESIRQVNDSSEEIASITDLINEIAFQTNLLALNAAVEAARAGEQGRGFAVVASEVRALAGRSAEAAKQIEILVKDSIGKVVRGTEQVNRTGEALQNIVTSITKVSAIVSEITSASEEQSVGIGEINRAITQLENVTQNNLDLVANISGVSDNLTQQSSDISEAIAVFRVDGSPGKGTSTDARRSKAVFEDYAEV